MRPPSPLVALILAGTLLGAGCANRYLITTTDGMKLVTASKPKRVQDWFVYKDATGTNVYINAMRVRVIEPYSSKAAGKPLTAPDLR